MVDSSVEFSGAFVIRFQYKTDNTRVAAVAVDTAIVRALDDSNKLVTYRPGFELLRKELFKLQAMSTSADQTELRV